MDIKRDVSILFKDKQWVKKTLIGGFFMMIPVANLLSFGFLAEFIYSHIERGEKKLPSWNNWGNLFLRGFEFGLVIVLYLALPILFLSLMPESLFTFLVNPVYVYSQLRLGGYIWLTLSALFTIIAIFFIPMAIMHFADTRSLKEAFLFEKVFEHIKENLTPYLSAYILTIFLLAFIYFLHIVMTEVKFGIIPSYFIFVWFLFIVLLISESLFIESF